MVKRLVLCLLLIPLPLFGAREKGKPVQPRMSEWEVTVTKVHDGDTITCQVSRTVFHVRLAEIDAPELKQTSGPEAKAALEKLILGKQVWLRWNSTMNDRYGRSIGNVYATLPSEDERGRPKWGEWINLRMVKDGWAWRYPEYSKTPSIADAEKEARGAKLGLWKDADPTPPWVFRNKGK